VTAGAGIGTDTVVVVVVVDADTETPAPRSSNARSAEIMEAILSWNGTPTKVCSVSRWELVVFHY
jgi:hypothetical protein